MARTVPQGGVETTLDHPVLALAPPKRRLSRRSLKLSVIIPAHNEEQSVGQTVLALTDTLRSEGIDHEVIVVDDASTDGTSSVVAALAAEDPVVRYLRSPHPPGFGFAVRAGLEAYGGDTVAIVMADLSDDPRDLVAYHRLLEAGYDCAFGSRFIRGGSATGYPVVKLAINRAVNLGLRMLFGHGYNDTTNAFKAYRREVIENVQPLLSHHFNLTVEIPLKAVVRGHSYAIVPIAWRNRATGDSKLRLKEMGSRYLFIALYVFFESHLTRGDYLRRDRPAPHRGRWHAGAPSARVVRGPPARSRSEPAA
jgi:dolichol-phosphate mannosyltransferase